MESFPRRYEIYIANLDPTVGGKIRKSRPVVIVSHDAMNRLIETVVVYPLTTSIHPRWRGRIQVICDGRDAEIAVDQIRAISKRSWTAALTDSPGRTLWSCAVLYQRCTASESARWSGRRDPPRL